MLYYTTTQLGPTREKTPEGFLLCRDVPIGRTGMQVYGPGETPVEDGAGGTVRIHRRPEDVFRAETMASFNGKPVTLDHPDTDVNPENWKDLAVGVVLDTRQGEGAKNNLLLADLLITDGEAIRQVLEDGLREVSCGYEAEYEQESPGTGYQVEILGNHVALVEQGRCGNRCSIGDAEGEMKFKGMSVVEFKDAVRRAAKSDNELETVLATVTDTERPLARVRDQEGETHIHIHSEGEAGAEDQEPDEFVEEEMAMPEEDPMLARLAGIEDLLSTLEGRLSALESGGGSGEGDIVEEITESIAGDENPFAKKDDEEEKKDKTDDADEEEEEEKKDDDLEEEVDDSVRDDVVKVGDSRYMEPAIQSTMATAEVLSPGIKFPEFAEKDKPRKTLDRLTTLRKQSLGIAASTPHGATILAELRGGRPLAHDSLRKLSVKATRDLFYSAGAMMKQRNRKTNEEATPGVLQMPASGSKPTLAQMNEINRKFWAERA